MSKESNHYDNKSTTIIIHDKDITTDNLHISVYKKRKDRSVTNEPSNDHSRKFSARQMKDSKVNDKDHDKIEFATITKNSPFQKYYQSSTSGNSKRKKTRSKKHHTGSDILLKEQDVGLTQEKNYSVNVSATKPLAELYKPAQLKEGRYKKK